MEDNGMKITSVKGTNDYLPNEVEIRDYLQNEILKVYVENGFEHITTPVIEDIENLDKSDGGENLNLIFKIMKRGDKLDKALASGVTSQNENVLADMGLRYDLTLPLSRYFANNKDKLTLPMKCIQMDRVYRAERPQKGRLREFVQCDIDIIGSWIWISGETYPIKDELKKLGFKWSKGKSKWFFTKDITTAKKRYSKKSYDDLKSIYGCETVKKSQKKYLTA